MIVLCLQRGEAMKTLFVGILSSVIGGFALMIIWTYFGEPIFISLPYSFSPVSGDYVASYPDRPGWPSESIHIEQLGSKISGKFQEPEKREEYDLTGRVTSSRMVTYQFTPRNTRINDYGVGLIKIDKQGEGGSGYVLYLSDGEAKPVPVRVTVKAVKKPGK